MLEGTARMSREFLKRYEVESQGHTWFFGLDKCWFELNRMCGHYCELDGARVRFEFDWERKLICDIRFFDLPNRDPTYEESIITTLKQGKPFGWASRKGCNCELFIHADEITGRGRFVKGGIIRHTTDISPTTNKVRAFDISILKGDVL